MPLGVTAGNPSYEAWVALTFLEVSFFVNAAGLFMLSALIEKNKAAHEKYMMERKQKGEKGDKKMNKEVTTVNMPPALIEGSESMALFCMIVCLPEY